MRKNRTMRLAAILLVLTLLTTCVISGTFAKYVTSGNSNDTARVAKWGVVITAASDSSFETEYATDDSSKYSGALSVTSSSGDNVVAPGTKGDAISFTISGTPEVATKVDIVMEVTSDIHVDDYYPVVFTLKQGENVVAEGNLVAIKEAVETYAETAYYAPNTDLSAEFELTWEWVINGNNDLDTLLGNVAADSEYEVGSQDVSTEIKYAITFTVTQVD